MNWTDIFDIKSLFASIFSGALVLLVAGIYKIFQVFLTKKKLRTLLYYEIFLLHSHLVDVIKVQIDNKKDWFRTQTVPGMKLTVFNNSKVQESLIGLSEKEIVRIVRFYNYYESIESKMILYCKHLEDKMSLSISTESMDKIKKYENLLISSTNIISEDFSDIKKIYIDIEKSKDFQKVVKKLNLS